MRIAKTALNRSCTVLGAVSPGQAGCDAPFQVLKCFSAESFPPADAEDGHCQKPNSSAHRPVQTLCHTKHKHHLLLQAQDSAGLRLFLFLTLNKGGLFAKEWER